MAHPQNIEEVADLNPNYMGFIFYPPSKRYFLENSNLEQITKSILAIPTHIYKVGVFVNESVEKIGILANQFQLSHAQLHGTESPQDCAQVQALGLKVIKAFSITPNFDFETTTPYINCTDLFLFDTEAPSIGGSGQTFNWNILQNYKESKPYLLAGGLSIDNIDQAFTLPHNQLLGFDLNSKFEIQPGFKNIALLKNLFAKKRIEQ